MNIFAAQMFDAEFIRFREGDQLDSENDPVLKLCRSEPVYRIRNII